MRHPSGLFLTLTLVFIGCQSGTTTEHDEAAYQGHDDHDKPDDHKRPDDHNDTKPDAHDEEEEGVVHLTAEAIARSEIHVATVSAGRLTGTIEVPAEVQLNPDQVAHINPLVNGQLLSIEKKVGDTVVANQPLARMRSVELGQARAELRRTSSLREAARQTHTRQKQLRSDGINSKRSLLEAQLAFDQADAERDAARSRLQVFGVRGGSGPDMALPSPIAGVVIERHATRGETVSPDDTLFIVADLSEVWIIGRVYEQQVAQITEKMPANLTLSAYPERTWSGTVDYIGASLDPTTRTLPIRIELDNSDGLLRPGLFGSLQLTTHKGTGSTVLVPLTAIQTMEKQSVVFVPGHEPGEFVMHPVTLGRQGRRQAEVVQGLKPGAKIVVGGAFVLKSELMRDQLGHGHTD